MAAEMGTVRLEVLVQCYRMGMETDIGILLDRLGLQSWPSTIMLRDQIQLRLRNGSETWKRLLQLEGW